MRDYIMQMIRDEIQEELIHRLPKGDRALMLHLSESDYGSQTELAEWMQCTQGWVNQLLCGMYTRAYRGSIYTRARALVDQTDLLWWMRLLERYPPEETIQEDADTLRARLDLISPVGDEHAPASVRRVQHVTSENRKIGRRRKKN